MSIDLTLLKNTGSEDKTLKISSYYGGDKKGTCFQITDTKSFSYIQLTLKDLILINQIVQNHLVEMYTLEIPDND